MDQRPTRDQFSKKLILQQPAFARPHPHISRPPYVESVFANLDLIRSGSVLLKVHHALEGWGKMTIHVDKWPRELAVSRKPFRRVGFGFSGISVDDMNTNGRKDLGRTLWPGTGATGGQKRNAR